MKATLDPVVLTEQLARLEDTHSTIRRASTAAKALRWFAEYALDDIGYEPLKVVATVVASGTAYAETVKPYLEQAAKQHAADILASAIMLAQADYDAGLEMLK